MLVTLGAKRVNKFLISCFLTGSNAQLITVKLCFLPDREI